MCSLLNRNHPHAFDFRSHSMTVRSTKYMAPSFADTLPTGTCIPGVPPVGEGGHDKSRAQFHVPDFTGDAISKVQVAQESFEERSFGKMTLVVREGGGGLAKP
jgi:hypothetical protein